MSRWVTVTVLVVALAVLGGCQGAANVEATRYSLDVQVGPVDDDPNGVICHVVLSDATSGEVILKPVVLTSWGEAATITQRTEAESFVMTVMADNETQRVEYSAQYLRNGLVVFESRAQVSLTVESEA